MPIVHVTPVLAPLPEDEFWRDVDAVNRCNDPKQALRFLSSLIVRRARWEAGQQHPRLTAVEYEPFIQTRARELWHRCRSMGLPSLYILSIVPIITIKFPEEN